MLIFLRGGVPHIDDGFGEVRPLREEEAQVLALSVEALSAPDPDAEAVFSAEAQPHLVTWRRALALSAVGSQEVPLPELDAVATVLAHGNLDRAAYLGGLMAAARAWRGTLEGNIQDLAKARRWITAHPNGPGSRGIPLLIESTADGGAKIIGGAGGKLNGQKLGSLKPGAGGEAKNTREHKAEADAKNKEPPKSKHGTVDTYVGRPPPDSLKYKRAADRIVTRYHEIRHEADKFAARSGREAVVNDSSIQHAIDKEVRAVAAISEADAQELRQWADAFVASANKHRTITPKEAFEHSTAVFNSPEAQSERSAHEKIDAKRIAEREQRRRADEPAAQAKRIAIAQKLKDKDAPWPATQSQTVWLGVMGATGARAAAFDSIDVETQKAAAISWLSGLARTRDETADRTEDFLEAEKRHPDASHTLTHPRMQEQIAESRKDAEKYRQLAARVQVQGMPPRPTKGSLAKARMVMTMPQRLAKSTLAPVAAPAQRVTVGDTLALWRTNDTGMGVLEIPLKSGKSLLVLANDLALALREGAAELALVLKGLAPSRALISMPGRFKTARKPA